MKSNVLTNIDEIVFRYYEDGRIAKERMDRYRRAHKEEANEIENEIEMSDIRMYILDYDENLKFPKSLMLRLIKRAVIRSKIISLQEMELIYATSCKFHKSGEDLQFSIYAGMLQKVCEHFAEESDESEEWIQLGKKFKTISQDAMGLLKI